MLKHLDIVETPKGGIALVKEVSMTQGLRKYSLIYFKNPGLEPTAWWAEINLTKIANLPKILAKAMAHPFGNGEKIVETEMS